MLYFLLGLITLRLSYWYFLFIRLAWHKQALEITESKAISLVVAVKNNLAGIKALTFKIQKQNYAHWELIVVDDGSDEQLKNYIAEQQTPNIRYLLNTGHPGKKHALVEGIRAAQHPWVAVTDADCVPASLRYFDVMQASLVSPNHKIVLGFAPLRATGSLASHLASYEAAYIGMQYLSYAKAGMPYMGVGRNMLFDKELYLQHASEISEIPTLSGDDDLFIQAAATPENTTICIHPYSFCVSDAPSGFGEWIKQRTRQISTASHYQSRHRLLLGGFAALHLGIYALFLLCLIGSWLSPADVLAVWTIMIGLMTLIQYPVFRKLKSIPALLWTPIADIFLAGFYAWIAIRYKTKHTHPWK